MRFLKPAAAALFLTALLAYPETALNAAREAMYAWYKSVAPALFPFMALTPLLTCPESVRAYERLLGRWMRPLLNLPGSAAPAVAIGMTAGSPTGAAAALRACAAAGLSRAELERIVCCVGGMSPAFLITGIGASMLGSPADGYLLMRAQFASQLALLIATRRIAPDEPLPPPADSAADLPLRAAVSGALAVCGYMMLFSVAAALIARIARSEWAGLAAVCLLELPSAARAVSALALRRETRLLMLAALAGLGGMCIAAQNLSACRRTVRPARYLAARLAQAALMTAFTALQLRFPLHRQKNPLPVLEISAFIAAVFALIALFSREKDQFLNKRNSGKNPGF